MPDRKMIKSIVAYICAHYPHKHELSKARLTKMVYLVDWESALQKNKTLTGLEWYFNHYGPYVDDVLDSLSDDEEFKVVGTENMFGANKGLVSYNGDWRKFGLDPSQRKVVDKVIEATKAMYWGDFIKYVYSTPPVLAFNRYQKLDLVSVAKSQRRIQA